MERPNAWKAYKKTELKKVEKLSDAYKAFLDAGKTERECAAFAIRELEKAGYLERRQLRDDHGRMADVEYIIYETPLRSEPRTDLPYTENPNTVEPNTVFPDSDNPDSEKPTQLNTNIPITKESKTKRSNG